jgi:hypothetical protein
VGGSYRYSSGIPCNSLELFGTPWDSREFMTNEKLKICLPSIEFHGIPWNSLESPGIS